jgi:hypothetical protein
MLEATMGAMVGERYSMNLRMYAMVSSGTHPATFCSGGRFHAPLQQMHEGGVTRFIPGNAHVEGLSI